VLSVIGTGIAAAVAQTGLQSQQVAGRRDRRENNRTRQAQRDTEIFETRLIGLEEHDGDEAATRLHVDNEQTDREQHPDLQQDEQAQAHETIQDQANLSGKELPDADTLMRQLAATADPAIQRKATQDHSDPASLYAHIDLEA